MVRGLERFREHFADFVDRYLIIGGTACDLALTEAGLEFRATRDIREHWNDVRRPEARTALTRRRRPAPGVAASARTT